MKCSKCHHNEASVYIEQNLNGEIRKFHLCGECAFGGENNNAIGFGANGNGAVNIDLGQAFHAMHNFWFAPEADVIYKSHVSKPPGCPVCGHSFSNFKKSSLLGCVACYEAFEPELLSVFGKLQPGTRHVGKIPKAKGHVFAKDRELMNLRAELQDAISKEQYEDAARIRDTIRAIEA